MGKKSFRKPKKVSKNTKVDRMEHRFDGDDMDDEVDAFHKQREVIPLDVDADSDDALDADAEMPVFDLEASDSDTENEEEDDGDTDDNTDHDGVTDDVKLKVKDGTLATKIERQAKFLRQRIGGVEEDIDGEDEEEENKTLWGRYKNMYFGADNANFEQLSSDEELRAEEDEALRMQREKAKTLSMEDFGFDDSGRDDDDRDEKDKSLEAVFSVKPKEKAYIDEGLDSTEHNIEIKKNLDALSREEQMDVVYSSAPELIGLLSELNEALDQCKITQSFSSQVKERKNCSEGAIRYLEVKQGILLAYCQAIGFYLLLKSEGLSVRDHPVVARLVELKELMEKVKKIDQNLPSNVEIEEAKTKELKMLEQKVAVKENAMSKLKSSNEISMVSEMDELVNVGVSKDNGLESVKIPEQNVQVDLQSKNMLKLRASLEEKLKQKGLYNSIKSSRHHSSHAISKLVVSRDDFDDEVAEPVVHGSSQALFKPAKLSQMVKTKGNKPAFVSGDDDLPQRDDIGERRRKHELRVLSRVGTNSVDDDNEILADEDGTFKANKIDNGPQDNDEGEDEFYKEAKRQRVSKLSAKAEKYSRELSSLPEAEMETDGKRSITYQIEKNRGLTRHRKKEIKNPRKKYKMKHKKALIRRKGQVRDIKKPSGPYGGEATGINIGISRSIRFKN